MVDDIVSESVLRIASLEPGTENLLRAEVKIYYKAVVTQGQDSYDKAQNEARAFHEWVSDYANRKNLQLMK